MWDDELNNIDMSENNSLQDSDLNDFSLIKNHMVFFKFLIPHGKSIILKT